jgi:hypothetical protein
MNKYIHLASSLKDRIKLDDTLKKKERRRNQYLILVSSLLIHPISPSSFFLMHRTVLNRGAFPKISLTKGRKRERTEEEKKEIEQTINSNMIITK